MGIGILFIIQKNSMFIFKSRKIEIKHRKTILSFVRIAHI